MTYEQAKKLEEKHRAQGRRNMVTAYVFLLLSAIVFGIFYLKVHELTLAGCGFLCDAAALLYLLRAAPAVIPFRQASLAAKCAASPSEETVYALFRKRGRPVKSARNCRKTHADGCGIACINMERFSRSRNKTDEELPQEALFLNRKKEVKKKR